jgi:hypothetical protein
VKIRDIKTMMIQGPRTYTLVKVETDSRLYGIAEGYGSPGVGVREQILALKPALVGKDPRQSIGNNRPDRTPITIVPIRLLSRFKISKVSAMADSAQCRRSPGRGWGLD